MSEIFDDFARGHEQARMTRESLAKETDAEWEILKGEVSKFAIDCKTFNGYPFSWFPEPGAARLVLNDVAAFLLDGGVRDGVPEGYRVRFDRRPPRPGRQFTEDARVPATSWLLAPTIEDGEFRWSVSKQVGRKSSAELAEEIAKQLSRHHVAYETALGRAS